MQNQLISHLVRTHRRNVCRPLRESRTPRAASFRCSTPHSSSGSSPWSERILVRDPITQKSALAVELWREGEHWFWSPEDPNLNSVFQVRFLHLLHEDTKPESNAGFYLFPLWHKNYPTGGWILSGTDFITSTARHHVLLGKTRMPLTSSLPYFSGDNLY